MMWLLDLTSALIRYAGLATALGAFMWLGAYHPAVMGLGFAGCAIAAAVMVWLAAE